MQSEMVLEEILYRRKISIPCCVLIGLLGVIIGVLPLIPSGFTQILRPLFILVCILFAQHVYYPVTKASKTLIVYICYLTIIWGTHRITRSSTMNYMSMVLFAAMFIFATHRIWSYREIKIIFNVLIFASLFCAVVLLYYNPSLRKMNGAAELSFFTSLKNRNPMAFSLVPGTVCSLIIAFYQKNRKRFSFETLYYWLCFAVCGFTVIATGSRSASLAMLVSVFLSIWEKAHSGTNMDERLVRRLEIAFIAVVGINLLLLLTAGTDSSRIFGQFHNLNGREDLWDFAWKLIHAKPVFGGGFDYWDNNGGSSLYTHNTYLMIMVISGYVGAGFLTVFLFSVFYELWTIRNYAIIALVIQLLLHIYTETTLDYYAYIPLVLAYILFQQISVNNRSLTELCNIIRIGKRR